MQALLGHGREIHAVTQERTRSMEFYRAIHTMILSELAGLMAITLPKALVGLWPSVLLGGGLRVIDRDGI